MPLSATANAVSVSLGLGSNGVGSGTFAPYPFAKYSLSPNITGFSLIDIDGDGILDVAATSGATMVVVPGSGSMHVQ